MYLVWYDDSKKPAASKIQDAIHAFTQRFSIAPTIVLLHETAGDIDIPGVVISVRQTVQKHCFWVGAA